MKLLFTIAVTASLGFATETTQSETKVELPRESLFSVGLDVKYAPIRYSRYEMAPGSAITQAGVAGMVRLEWLPIQKYGKLGIGGETGFFGIANQTVDQNRFATVYTLPIGAQLSYHFDFIEDQIIVPFVSIGTSVTYLKQQSSTGAAIANTLSYQGWEYTFGAQLCMNKLDTHGAKSFKKNYGIDNTYIVFDYTRSQPLYLSQAPNLSYEVYRVGFRLEI